MSTKQRQEPQEYAAPLVEPTDSVDEQFQHREGPVDPFEGDSREFEVTKEINVEQITQEISAKAKRQVSISLWTGEFGRIASEKAPGILYVSPKSVSERDIQGVIAAHIARKEPTATASPSVPAQVTPEVQAIAEKLASSPSTVSLDELRVAVSALLGVTPAAG